MGRRTNTKALGIKIAQRQKSKDRVTQRDYKEGEKEAVKAAGGYSMGGKVPKGYHRMPNGKLMKDSAMKKKMGGGMMKQPMGYDKGGPSFNYDTKHQDVQGLKKFINKNRKEKDDKRGPISDQKAKKLADRLRTKAIKRTSATEGSFSTGGEATVRGMGAAIKGGKFQGVF